MKYSDRQLAGLSVRKQGSLPPDRVEFIDAGSLGYGTGPASAEGSQAAEPKSLCL